MKRVFTTFCASLAIAGALAVAQEGWAQGNYQPTNPNQERRQRLHRPQNPANFSPDPPPVPQPAIQPVTQPVAQPGSPTAAAAAQAQPGVAAPEAQQPENLPPPTAAQVTYRNGMLTVEATNSTLGGLLSAIRNKTGIQFEGLEGGGERVAISMGPAPEGEVLATILGGSKYDYIVVERPDSPGIVQKVLLSHRAGSAAVTAGATPPPPPAMNAEGDDEDSGDEPETPQDTPVRPPLTQVQPQPQQMEQSQPKTPEQLLDELKRMQQQTQPGQPQTTQPPAPIKPPQ